MASSRVVLPAPLGPTMAVRPGWKRTVASTKLLTLRRETSWTNTSAHPSFQVLRQRLGGLALKGGGLEIQRGGGERLGLVGVGRLRN